MKKASQTNISWLTVTKLHGAPRHVHKLDISGQKFSGFLLCSIDKDNQKQRNTLVLPKQSINYFPPEIKDQLKKFSEFVIKYARECKMKTAPALNKLASEYRARDVTDSFNVATIIYRSYGAIPALVIGKYKSWQCAVVPDLDEDFSEEPHYSEEECLEILKSLDSFFPLLCNAYYEQFAYYANAIFFGADDEDILKHCFKIRNLLEISIGKKIGIFYNPVGLKAKALAAKLRRQFAYEISIAATVKRVGELFVKYLYACYGVNYTPKLKAGLKTSFIIDQDLDQDVLKDFLGKCERYYTYNDSGEDLIREIHNRKESIPEWAQLFGYASRFVGEIRRAANNKDSLLPTPKVFLGHHFKVKPSELFHAALAVKAFNSDVRVLRGRNLGANIQWSMLALIWLADHQLLFIPDALTLRGGEIRKLKSKGDWVIKELLYGQYIKARLTLIVSNQEVKDQIKTQICTYTDRCELDQITPEEWFQFVKSGKHNLVRQFDDDKHIEYNPIRVIREVDLIANRLLLSRTRKESSISETKAAGYVNLDKLISGELEEWFGFAEEAVSKELVRTSDLFLTRLRQDVFDKAAELFVRNLFLAWSKVFLPEAWSVAQMLIHACRDESHGRILLDDLVKQMEAKGKENDRRYRWVVDDAESIRIKRRIKNYLSQLSQQPLLIAGNYIPITARLKSGIKGPEISVTLSFQLILDKYASIIPEKSLDILRKDINAILLGYNIERTE